MKNKRIVSKFCLITLVIALMAGLASAETLAPTVTKSASPADINLKGSGGIDETTVTIEVTGAGGTSTTITPMDVVFALDSSGSMAWNDPYNDRKEAAKSFVDKMASIRDQAGVVSWDSAIDFTYGLSSDFPTVKEKIDNVNSSGGTNLDVGLTAAIDKEEPVMLSVHEIRCKSILNRSSIPGLDYTINPYLGCLHGCVYSMPGT